MIAVPKLIVSLCDYSGRWSQPYRDRGYRVIQVDPKLPTDLARGTLGLTVEQFAQTVKSPAWRNVAVQGVLAAPPCTDFAGSGARWWATKDRSGSTAGSVMLIMAVMDIIDTLRPQWWALENPVGRLSQLCPRVGTPRMAFHPHQYALLADDPRDESYTKKTQLWGSFNTQLQPGADTAPLMFTTKNGKRGAWYWMKLGGKSERTKTLRSNTPTGFARAFAEANP